MLTMLVGGVPLTGSDIFVVVVVARVVVVVDVVEAPGG